MTAAPSDPRVLLRAPGGGRLCAEAGALLAEDGRLFPVESGIVRMLEPPDPLLRAELAAQHAALPLYLDERLLITRYEHEVARLVVEELWGDDGLRKAGAHPLVLDAGCGIGLLGRLYPDLGLCGVDASFALLAQAQQGYRLRVECNVEQLPFEDGTFDAVLAVNMLHHVIRPEAAVAEFARVLVPGGLLLGVDPRRVGWIELAKRVLRRRNDAYAETHRAFAPDEYAALLAGGGALDLEELRQVGFLVLLGAGGLDAVGLSRRLPRPQAALDWLRRADALLLALPGAERLGLNFAARARRPV